MVRRGPAWRVCALAALLLSVVLLGPTASALPAAAQTPGAAPYGLAVSPRDQLAIASWVGVDDAASYVVDVSADPTFTVITSTTATEDLVVLGSLTPATTYYARVSAVSTDGTRGSPSESISFTTSEEPFRLPTPELTVDSLSSTSLTPAWSSSGDDLRYEVQRDTAAGFDSPESDTTKAGVRTETMSGLKTSTSYSVRVRAVDAAGLPLSAWSNVVTRKTAESLPLRVGTFNVRKKSQDNWAKRRTAVASTILGQDPDVVGLQEATPARFRGVRQYQDVVNLLGSDWALTDASSGSGEVRTVYNTTRLRLLDHGTQPLSGSKRFGVQRYATWAAFEQISTGKRFLFVNTHFAVFSSKVKAHHTAAARQMVAMLERVNTGNLPVVIVGDFNTGLYRTSGNGVYRTITGAGYIDPLVRTGKTGAAQKLVNADLKTYNGGSRKAPKDRWARMLDQIFVSKMRVAEWETVARLNGAGRWIGTIPSDHNMVRATVYLP
ncbi:fibronectin type III domain-containing protein [Propionicimonas sp.]|uniref:fibronectin type III domain-containing protein n=1 Tax=Propionicimonas sp. TaxID=1955623 RepID=UPI0039E504E8